MFNKNGQRTLLTGFSPEAVPEPSFVVLAGTAALVGLGIKALRRRV